MNENSDPDSQARPSTDQIKLQKELIAAGANPNTTASQVIVIDNELKQ